MQVPPEGHLGRGLMVVVANLLENRIREDGSPAQRTPGLGHNTVLTVKLDQGGLVQAGVPFNLVDDWQLARLGREVLQVDHLKVADSDGLG